MRFNSEKIFIAEIKNSRPNKAFHSTISLKARLSAYENADAISVVTHSSFSGSLELLTQVRKLTQKPILAKDFIQTPQEALALKLAGADGILLLKDMLTSKELDDLIKYCKKIDVTSFVESSFAFPEEGDFSVLNSRSLFSLQENQNNRDFISHNSTIHKNRTIIASSLVSTLSARLALSKNRGCIVGSALMEENNSSKIKQFIMQSKISDNLIKVCGARTVQDISPALKFDVDFIGINIIPTSRRFIGLENLKKLIPFIEKHQEKICFITRDDACSQCLKLISHLKSIEQCYSSPLLPNRIMLFCSSNTNFIGTTALVLDGEQPGSGQTTSYPNNIDNLFTPTFISAGINCENYNEKKQEALTKNWNIVGVDCSSSVCYDNLKTQLDSFSTDKLARFINKVKGVQV